MRIKPKLEARCDAFFKPWFAWRPIKINCGYPHELGTIVWLEWVSRKYSLMRPGAMMHYELLDSKPPILTKEEIEEINRRRGLKDAN